MAPSDARRGELDFQPADLRVRSVLHLEAKRNHNVLSHDLQEKAAEALDKLRDLAEKMDRNRGPGGFRACRRDAHAGVADPTLGRWVYYVGDIKGMPESLVAGDGTVLARYDHSAFGKAILRPGSTTSR